MNEKIDKTIRAYSMKFITSPTSAPLAGTSETQFLSNIYFVWDLNIHEEAPPLLTMVVAAGMSGVNAGIWGLTE